MTLWDVLLLVVGAAAFASSQTELDAAGDIGLIPYYGGLFVGLLTGIMASGIVWKTGHAVFKRYPESELVARSMYFLVGLFALVAPFWACFPTRLFLHFFGLY